MSSVLANMSLSVWASFVAMATVILALDNSVDAETYPSRFPWEIESAATDICAPADRIAAATEDVREEKPPIDTMG